MKRDTAEAIVRACAKIACYECDTIEQGRQWSWVESPKEHAANCVVARARRYLRAKKKRGK